MYSTILPTYTYVIHAWTDDRWLPKRGLDWQDQATLSVPRPEPRQFTLVHRVAFRIFCFPTFLTVWTENSKALGARESKGGWLVCLSLSLTIPSPSTCKDWKMHPDVASGGYIHICTLYIKIIGNSSLFYVDFLQLYRTRGVDDERWGPLRVFVDILNPIGAVPSLAPWAREINYKTAHPLGIQS